MNRANAIRSAHLEASGGFPMWAFGCLLSTNQTTPRYSIVYRVGNSYGHYSPGATASAVAAWRAGHPKAEIVYIATPSH